MTRSFIQLIFGLMGLLCWGTMQAQSTTCNAATAICDNVTPYPAQTTGNNAPAGNNYDCLLSTPDPAWFYFTIAQSGSISMALQNSNTVDVDFILWGPFPNVAAALTQCGNLGNGGAGGTVIDCSFDPQAFEQVDIPNAVAGQVYVMMVTNYSGANTTIFTQPNTGTGDIACPCNIRSRHFLTPIAGNRGTLISSQDSAAQYGLCANDTMYFSVGMRSATTLDSLGFSASATTIGSVLNPNQFGIFGPFYPVAGRFDTMEMVVAVYPGVNSPGIYNFNIGVTSTNRSTRVICPEVAPVSIIVPGMSALDTAACSGQTLQLGASSGVPATVFGSPSFSWTQIGGPATTLTNANTTTPTVVVPIGATNAGTPSLFQVQYTYGTCTIRDTVQLNYPTVQLNLAPNPAAVCLGSSTTLSANITDTLAFTNACLPTYSLTSIPFAPVAGTGTTVSLGDDQVSAALPIGFNFRFFCNTYSNFYIGSNGFITFSAAQPANQYAQTIPNAATPNNLIALAWSDLDPSSGGSVRYFTTGTAPNRRLVVTFSNVDYYYLLIPGGTISVQAVLYETSNIIELHITNVDNELNVTQGIENAAGSSAVALAGRNRQAFSASNQSFRFTPTPGPVVVTPPTYAWSPATGLSSSSIFNPVASPTVNTTYNVTVTDGVCRYTGNIPVTVGQLNVALSVTNASCAAPTGGSIGSTITGGPAPYTYVWSNGATTQNVSGLAAGNYRVTVTASNGCTGTSNASITAPIPPTLSNTVTNVLCSGDTTGAINLTVTGGLAPFSYVWSNGRTTQNLNGISAGNYRVTVTAANGCTVSSATIAVTQSNGITITTSAINNVRCNGANNGSINMNVVGGTTPYSFSWSNGATTQNVSGLGIGTYSLVVRDANGCSATSSSVVITQPAVLTVTPLVSNIICNGASSGAINASTSGGTAPYSYTWSNGRTSQSINLLAAGTYTVTVRDANSCSISTTATVTQPAAVTASIVSITNVSCNLGNDGAISINPSGGTSPYTYSWSNGATAQNVSGLAAGTYSVTVRDAAACAGTVTNISVSQPAAITLTQDSIRNISCNGASDGMIFISVAGGTSPYTYSWSGGQTAQDVSGLAAGTYSVTVRDANSCSVSRANILIIEPAAITVTSTSILPAACGASNGSIAIAVSGGNPIFTFLWSNGATTQNVNNLAGGNYVVTATDARGCTAVQNFNVSSSSSLSVSTASVQNVSCNAGNNGAIFTNVTGGTSPFVFVWSNGATSQDVSGLAVGVYNLTVTDAASCVFSLNTVTISQPAALSVTSSTVAAGCNGQATGAASLNVSGGSPIYGFIWSNGATTQNLSGVAAGNYSVTITDANGCQINTNLTVGQPTSISVTLATTNVLCNGQNTGAISSSVAGGSNPYSFVWSNGSTSQNLSNIAAGTYGLTVSDASGCAFITTTTISQPTALSVSLVSSVNPTCAGSNNGAISTNTIGGQQAYSFRWSNGATTQNLANLAGGNYGLTVTDANGCTAVLPTLTLVEPTALQLAITPIVPILPCNLANVGELDAIVTGGQNPISLLWSNGQTNSNINGLAAGIYTITATDANGCSTVTSGSIIAPAVPNINPFIMQVGTTDTTLLYGETVMLNAGSSTAAGTYVWSELLQPNSAGIANPNQPQTTANPTAAGAYVFVINASVSTGGQVCSATDTLRLTVIEESFLGIPNAFTPNGDGNNDRFRPVNLDASFVKSFKVFNRWGQLVYDNSSLSDGGWDGSYKGELQPRDVYIYVLSYQFPQNPEPVEMRGEVTLIR